MNSQHPARFSLARMLAVFIKEFQQMMRDRLTFAMAVGVPIMQLVLFGYAINTDPKGLPTAIVSTDSGPMARGVLAAMQNTGYFRVDHLLTNEREAEALIETGAVQFMVVIPDNFSHRLVRGEKPALLVSADATDPSASVNAVAALNALVPQAVSNDLPGALRGWGKVQPSFEVRVHRRYNPEGLSRYNIVPGLVGTILTMTMVMLTSLAMTRERERGTMENLLATPVRPSEVMVGKILPYVVMGYVQLGVILGAAFVLFEVPMVGSFSLLSGHDRRLHCGQSGCGLHVFHGRKKPVAGHADDLLFLLAVHAAFGLHVSVQGHALVGAVGG
jgi:ABC-2 type transport system permease protein